MVKPSRPVAVVTGGSRGIGRAAVEELARGGFDVVVNYRGNAEAAEATCETARQLGAARAIAIQADVADIAQGRALVDQSLDQCGRIDVWVNNAGIAPPARRDILESTPESWDTVLGVNLRGPYFLTQYVARTLITLRQSGTIDDPQIHFITSVSSAFASTNRGEYCVSKAGLSMVAQLFAVRLAEFGIRVFEIRPGIIDTDMTAPVHSAYDQRFAQGLAPISRWGKPEEVGKVVAMLANGGLPYATGSILYVDGGFHLRRL
jgi:3-oxoacyl-[acyl-carrier protein] reductase